jgi:putative exosortase-associated protein (TIGR04073 family)
MMRLYENIRMTWVGVLALALLIPGAALGVEYTAGRKAGRGVAAVTTAYLEIPGNTIDEVSERGPWTGVPIGFTRGLVFMVVRIGVGTYEILTAPFEAPKGFEPIMEPEFAWGYFDQNYLGDKQQQIDRIAGAEVTKRRGALVVRFPNQLLFKFDSDELTDDAKARLDELAGVLKESDGSQIQVRGYTDSTGPNSANLALSAKRAEVVKGYLESQGVAPERLESDGFGSVSPVASNSTAVGRYKNRRVEFEVRAGSVAAK